MLKQYKTMCIAIDIVILFIALMSALFILLLAETVLQYIVGFAILIISAILAFVNPRIIEAKLIKKLFNDSTEVKIRINAERLRRDENIRSNTAKDILKMVNDTRNKNFKLLKDEWEDNGLALVIKAEKGSTVIHHSYRDPYCGWLVRYTKYFEVI